jgi:hypothetical protein
MAWINVIVQTRQSHVYLERIDKSMKRTSVLISLLCLGIVFSCHSARADQDGNCGRLKAGDNFNRINQILDCIESKIRTSLSPLPPAANSSSSGSPSRLPPPGVAKEPNNGIDEATEIPFGSSMKGKLTQRDPIDWYVFKTPDDVGDEFLVIFRYVEGQGYVGLSNPLLIEVYDSNEKKIAYSESVKESKSLTVKGEQKAEYYVKIYANNVDTNYELAVRNKTAGSAR